MHRTAISPALLAVLVAGAASCAGSTADDPEPTTPVRSLAAVDDGTATALRADELLTVTLDSRLSAGFAWRVDELDPSVLRLVDREHRSAPVLGGTDQDILHFAGVARGRTVLGLSYRRAWDPPGTGDAVYQVEVEVEGPYTGSYRPPVAAAAAAARVEAAAASPSSAPTRYDACEAPDGSYSRCTPIKDQGACGGCWAFATAGVFENVLYLGDPSRVPDFSEQYLISCNKENWGCGGGFAAFSYYVGTYVSPPETEPGAVVEADFPFVAANASCGSAPHPHHERAAGWSWVGGGSDAERVASIKQAILDHGPVWATVCTDTAFQDWTPAKGVFRGSPRPCGKVNHAVILVGWDDDGGYWILRNSWGPRWGDRGYMQIAWGANAVGSSAAYIVVDGTNQPPQARAGSAQTVDPGATVTLDGSASADADGAIRSWTWVQTSGPTVTLTAATAARATFTAPSATPGTLLAFRLTVRDDLGAESAAGTTVTLRDGQAASSPPGGGGGGGGCGTGGAAVSAWSLVLGALVAWRRAGRRGRLA